MTNHRPDSVNCTDLVCFVFLFFIGRRQKLHPELIFYLVFAQIMSESDTSVESIDIVASVSPPAELSINLLSKNRRKRRKTSQISARQSAEQLKNPDLYADGEILFCQVCEKSLDHSREGTITHHFKSQFHNGNMKGGKENSKKQMTLKTTLQSKLRQN